MLKVANNENYMIVGEVEFHIILAKVQNSFCIIAFYDKVFCQQLLPEVWSQPSFLIGIDFNP